MYLRISAQKLKIKGSLAAQTFCGNSLSISFEATIKPGESRGGKDYLMDDVGLTGTVQFEDCKTDKIYPDPNDKSSYKYDRICALQLGALNITSAEPTEISNSNTTTSQRQQNRQQDYNQLNTNRSSNDLESARQAKTQAESLKSSNWRL